MMDELNPCPNCNRKPGIVIGPIEVDRGWWEMRIECDCFEHPPLIFGHGKTEEIARADAVSQWNQR